MTSSIGQSPGLVSQPDVWDVLREHRRRLRALESQKPTPIGGGAVSYVNGQLEGLAADGVDTTLILSFADDTGGNLGTAFSIVGAGPLAVQVNELGLYFYSITVWMDAWPGSAAATLSIAAAASMETDDPGFLPPYTDGDARYSASDADPAPFLRKTGFFMCSDFASGSDDGPPIYPEWVLNQQSGGDLDYTGFLTIVQFSTVESSWIPID